jgi:hypothetical protein
MALIPPLSRSSLSPLSPLPDHDHDQDHDNGKDILNGRGNGLMNHAKLEKKLTEDSSHLDDDKGAEPFHILLAAYAILLHKYTNETDICIGSSSASFNPLVLRLSVTENDTFEQVVHNVMKVCSYTLDPFHIKNCLY